MRLGTLDITVIVVYAAVLLSLAAWASRRQHAGERTANDYFLAGKTLPWWVIGTSVIAANISAEQIVGMSGSGYVLGAAIAAYEWLAAIGLLIVAKWLLPVFIEHRITTMPQFLGERYNESVRLIMAVFWLLVYIFVNLTSVLWLGGLTIKTLTGLDEMLAMLLLAGFACTYSLYGGLRAVAFTDVLQVAVLVAGGSFLSWLLLDRIGDGAGVFAGLQTLYSTLPGHFDLVLPASHAGYRQLPGWALLFGGLWVMIISYFGFNQYIIQRALGAEDLHSARQGLAFAAALKLVMPVIVVLPGIAAALLAPELDTPDRAYPLMLQLMPEGGRGVVFAALVAAIVSSVGSMTNSVATIFTMDIYTRLNRSPAERRLVGVGRLTVLTALALAVATARPLLGETEQAFQYIQEFTGCLTPGVTVLFLLGMFWPRMTASGALSAAIGSVVLSIILRQFYPEEPFLNRVGYVFVLCLITAVIVSLSSPRTSTDTYGVDRARFATNTPFNVSAILVIGIVGALYAALS